MKLAAHILWICSLFSLNISCHQEELDHPVSEHPVLFQFEIVNHAWGYLHSGWLIDNEGSVRFYNLPDDWIFPDAEGFISKEAILSNLSKADSIIYQANLSSLDINYRLIPFITEDFISKGDYHIPDSGRQVLTAYRWDESQQKYKQVFLAQNGVTKRLNRDPLAQQLTTWLIDVGKKAGYMSWI